MALRFQARLSRIEFVKKGSFKIENREIFLETGEIAKQASGAVLVRLGDTVVLVTVVAAEDQQEMAGADFFPLSVEYRERTAAAGKIPVDLSNENLNHRNTKF